MHKMAKILDIKLKNGYNLSKFGKTEMQFFMTNNKGKELIDVKNLFKSKKQKNHSGSVVYCRITFIYGMQLTNVRQFRKRR